MSTGDLKRKLQAVSASERHGMVKKTTTKKQASASEGSHILKTHMEALAAVSLLRFKRVPGGSEMWMDEWREMKAKAVAEAAMPVKKRKRVVKYRVPKAIMDRMVARSFRSVQEHTPAELAERTIRFRQYYQLTTFVDAKLREYQQVLIRQYNARGYAEGEIEVTDSEAEEEDANTAVDN